jgi:hypothetical protein
VTTVCSLVIIIGGAPGVVAGITWMVLTVSVTCVD